MWLGFGVVLRGKDIQLCFLFKYKSLAPSLRRKLIELISPQMATDFIDMT